MIEKRKKQILLYSFHNMSQYHEITHFISTRIGGFSEGQYSSLNLGMKVNDKPEIVIKNRKLLAEAVSIPLQNFVIPSQSHTSNVAIINTSHKGMGVFDKDTAILETDAMITNEKEICLVVFGADCVPMIFYDPIKKVIAVAHAGWKGTVNKIAASVINKMQNSFSCHCSDIIASIGPSIGPCCYSIGDEVKDLVKKSFMENYKLVLKKNNNNQDIFDLWYANKLIMLEEGIPEKNIETANSCTSCKKETFYSHRAEQGKTGRFAIGIMMK